MSSSHAMSSSQQIVRVGIVGGGLMGREIASAFARWIALRDQPVRPVLTAVADPSPDARRWFEAIDSVTTLCESHRELLTADVDVVYVAVPHQLHEAIYRDVLAAGKDLLAEKPFGIDRAAARSIGEAVRESGRFVRCSSEMPFFPGAQRAYEYVRDGHCGRLLDVVSGFHHASDLDADKAANWKRQAATCGAIGVLGDLGMHAVHLPLRLGWRPRSVYAQLQKGFADRPDGRGGRAACDTWDNAALHTWVGRDADGKEGDSAFPLRLEMRRLAPGETNTWFFEARGTEGGVRFSTKHPKTLHLFGRDPETGEQWWRQTDLGFGTVFPTVTGGIFEPGFPDTIQQMWAAYLTERHGSLGDRFGCATPEEAIASHDLFDAALRSHQSGAVVALEE